MNLGEKQELTAVKKVEFGMYLAENPEDETRVYTGIPKTA